MTPERDDRLGAEERLSQPTECCPVSLHPAEIVGEVSNPVLEAVRRRFWRALDLFWYRIVLIRLSIFDRILGPERPTAADLKRDADHERLVSAFPAAGEPCALQPDVVLVKFGRVAPKVDSRARARKKLTI